MRKTIVAVLVFLMLAPTAALAEVTRDDLEEAQKKVREVSARLEVELTEIDRSIGMQDDYEARIAAIEALIRERQRDMVLLEFEARERARAMYMNAGAADPDSVLVVQDISKVGVRSAYLSSLIGQERDVVNDLLFLQNDSQRLQSELERLIAEEEQKVERLEDSAGDIYAELELANEEYQQVFEQWNKQEEERRRREEEARRRAEEERRRQAAAAAAAAAAASNYSSSAYVAPTGRTCPVAGAHSFRDSWLEPRSGGRQHHGLDMIAPRGTPLVAVESGYIWSKSYHYLGGNGIYVKGNSGDIYYYAHLDSYAPGMAQGVRVEKGQVIGYVGDTGNATGIPHLHLGYRPGGGPLTNPYQLMVKLCR